MDRKTHVFPYIYKPYVRFLPRAAFPPKYIPGTININAITGVHNNQDLILCVKIGICMVF